MKINPSYRGLKVALVIPCYNEETTIREVIERSRAVMPELDIHVFDNGSSDRTREMARLAGAKLHCVPQKGKGNVVRRIFADLGPDILVMTDGDATYDPNAIRKLVDCLIDEQLDMVVASRVTEIQEMKKAYRPLHAFGNRMLSGFVRRLFGSDIKDMLSGYRVFSRRFVKSFPALSSGFEIETELTIHALVQRMPYQEIPCPYYARQEGSFSKLSTFKDGARILATILRLYLREKPFEFFGLSSAFLALSSIGLSLPVLLEYFHSGLVPRLPTALLCATLMTLSLLLFLSGIILDSMTQSRREATRLSYIREAPTEPQTPPFTT